jgi:hypothetical protein
MRRKTYKRNKVGIKTYTALIPKTMKATKAVGSSVIKKINYFLSSAANTVKKTTKTFDKKTARSIRSLTKRHSRK